MTDAVDSVYVTYWSLNDPLCQSQSLPYLRGLCASGYRIAMVTFEQDRWALGPEQATEQRAQLMSEGIKWHPLRYHKRPPVVSTLFDIARGVGVVSRLARVHNAKLIHGRSTVACEIASRASRRVGTKLFVDADGPLSLEYAEIGAWTRDGALHRLVASREHAAIAVADTVAVLTEHRRAQVASLAVAPVHVLPCAVDMSRFAPDDTARDRVRARLGVEGTVFVYVGKPGGWYDTEPMLDFVARAKARIADLSLLIVTRESPEAFTRLCRPRGLEPIVVAATPAQVPDYLRAADVGLSFMKQSDAKLSSSPIKLAEYLAAGLTVVSTRGAGDYDAVIKSACAGAIMDAYTTRAYDAALDTLAELRSDGATAVRCRQAAAEHVGLDEVVLPRYRQIYGELTA